LEIAGWDASRIEPLMQWPVHELLLAYIAILKNQAMDRYQSDLQVGPMLAPHQKDPGKPSKPPKIWKS
jgi:hypothetical protein